MTSDLELHFHPQLPRVSVVRRFVEEFYQGLLDDEDLVSRIAMVAHELIENAAKYSVDGFARLRIHMRRGETDRLCVSVSNRTVADRLETLQSVIAEMERSPDALAYYQFALRRSSTLANESGLGLARIRAEGEMAVALVRDGDQVCVEASTSYGAAA